MYGIRILLLLDYKNATYFALFDPSSNMARIFSRLIIKARRGNLPDGKSVALVEAGIRLLAQKDYDAISMARISREASCAVGTLYERYSDKNTYLYRTIAQAFGYMTEDANRVLDGGRMGSESGATVAKRIVSHVTSQMTAPRAAGVIRATMKLSTVKPLALKPFENYRMTVTDHAVKLLTGRSRQVSAGAVRIGMQVVLGTVTDSIMQKSPGPMNAGSGRMTAALTSTLLGYLGLENKSAWAGNEANGEDEPADVVDAGSETAPQLDDGEIAIFDPDSRTYTGKRSESIKTRRSRRSKSHPTMPDAQSKPANKRTDAAKPTPKIAPLAPARVATRSSEPRANPSRKRKHRAI
jgi:AcrR family transcriptional regulator